MTNTIITSASTSFYISHHFYYPFYSILFYFTVFNHTLHHCTVSSIVVLLSILFKQAISYDIIWYDMKWTDTIWYDTIWYDMIWYDMIWYDMKWTDTIWYDMIRYDMIRYALYYSDFFCDRLFLTMSCMMILYMDINVWDDRHKSRLSFLSNNIMNVFLYCIIIRMAKQLSIKLLFTAILGSLRCFLRREPLLIL